MYLQYRLVATILAILAAMLPVRAALGDLYDVLLGESRGQADAMFVAYPGAPAPDLDATRSLSTIEQRAIFGGYHVPPNLLAKTRGLFAEKVQPDELPPGVHRWSLYIRVAQRIRTFNVYEGQRGDTFVQDLASQPVPAKAVYYKVHRQKLADLIGSNAPWYNSQRPAPALPPELPKPGSVGELAKPYLFGGVLFSEETLRTDFMFGSSSIAGTRRDLRNEKFLIRLPNGYTPTTPAGLLVWIDADSTGAPREQLFEALDAFNIVAVSAVNTGNDRPLSDRVQLAMDAMATASARVPIDTRRVYVGGISGGGRVASMLGMAFPQTFHACLCVVGVNSFHNVALPDGRNVQRATGTPNARVLAMLKGYKIAAITGPKDFNQTEIMARSQALKRSQIDCKVFDLPELGHQMPKPADLKQAIDWFDAEHRTSAENARRAADKRWDDALAKLPATGPLSNVQREELFKIDAVSTLSTGCWRALRRAYPDRVSFDESPAVTK